MLAFYFVSVSNTLYSVPGKIKQCCANVCPYGAISYEDKLINDHGIRKTHRVAVVNSALCQGCGACTVTCPSGAMDLKGFQNLQIMAEVDAICK